MSLNAPSLALVIPVHNDQARLSRVLRQAADLDIFDQVVIADDGSQEPAHAHDTGLDPNRVVLLRNTISSGAGGARNRALPAVATTHLLFFDSDDQLIDNLAALWLALQTKQFDFCLFRHHDSRAAWRGSWGQLPLDNALWRQAGAPGATLFKPTSEALIPLAETANYPWNKIYRTRFLLDHPSVRCSETPVHNDILLHWKSFLHAKTVLASDQIAAIHEVHMNGNRMTNRSDAERLCVFEPLVEVAVALAESEQPALRAAFFRFTAGLLDWVRTVMDPAHHHALDQATHRFLKTHLDPALFDRLSHSDPVLALRLCLQMAGGALPSEEALPC